MAPSKGDEMIPASRSFSAWLRRLDDGFTWSAPHQKLIIDRLNEVTTKRCRRLMLFVPPRHGKSELVTVRYTLWRLLRRPGMNIIVGCYNQRLANRFSRKIRKLASGRIVLARDCRAVDEWETAAGGGVKAVGVGAGVTGFGADMIVIDDPVKSRAQANSRTFRDRAWDWLTDDIMTRLHADASVILIQTRWHDDDLAGRLIRESEKGGEPWSILRLPALAESSQSTESDPLGRQPGEALWPSRFDASYLGEVRRRLGQRSFASLYQQRPVPEGGAVFRAEWFTRTVARAPHGLRWARGYDLAVSLKDTADHTASFRCAFDPADGRLYIADGFRGRIEYPDQRRFVIARMLAEPDTIHGIEQALHGMALVQDLRREPAILGRVLRGVRVDGDKLMRAQAWSSLAEEGRVVLVEGPWTGELIDELCRFTGKGDAHDDQVDAIGLAISMLRSPKRAMGF